MTSKEALNELFVEANRCSNAPYKYTTYDLLQFCKQIKEDLEVLETLKKHSSIIEIYSNVDKLGERFVCEISFNDKQYIEKLKEWLEK